MNSTSIIGFFFSARFMSFDFAGLKKSDNYLGSFTKELWKFKEKNFPT